MNADERQLIENLFARLRNLETTPKDRDADLLIQDLLRQSPDAPYYLTQSVLIQQQALERADARIRELEDSVRRTQDDGRAVAGSFLGGSSVPSSISRGPAPATRPLDPPPASPWASPAQTPMQTPIQTGDRSGGFMSSALSTATGAAGGMFLAEGIRSLLGGFGGRSISGGDSTSASAQAAIDKAQDDAQDARDDADQARKDLAADDAALDDTQDEQDAANDDDWSDDGSIDA